MSQAQQVAPITSAVRIENGHYVGGWDVRVNCIPFIARADGGIETMFGRDVTDAGLIRTIRGAIANTDRPQ